MNHLAKNCGSSSKVVRFQHSERLELELGLHIVSFLQLLKTRKNMTTFLDEPVFGKGVLISHSRNNRYIFS